MFLPREDIITITTNIRNCGLYEKIIEAVVTPLHTLGWPPGMGMSIASLPYLNPVWTLKNQ